MHFKSLLLVIAVLLFQPINLLGGKSEKNCKCGEKVVASLMLVCAAGSTVFAGKFVAHGWPIRSKPVMFSIGSAMLFTLMASSLNS